VLTQCSDASVGDDAAGELEECFVDVVADFPADAQAAESVDPGVRALYHPAMNAQARAVGHAAAGDERLDATLPQQTPVFVMVVAAVGKHLRGSVSRSASLAANVRYRVQQR